MTKIPNSYWPLVNLKKIRKELGKTQLEVADAIGISIATYRNWERGTNNPTERHLGELLEYLGCSETDLVMTHREYDSPASTAAPVVLWKKIARNTPVQEWYEEEDDRLYSELFVPGPVYERHPSSFALKMPDSSMDKVIPKGANVVADFQETEVVDGKAYVVCVGESQAIVRRVYRLVNGFELKPDSNDPTIKAVIVDLDEDGKDHLKIIGRVVWYTLPVDRDFEG